MPNDQKIGEFSVVAKASIDTPCLDVCSDLLGASHVFDFEGYRVTVTLPTIDVGKLIGDETGNHKISFCSWKENEGVKIPEGYEVHVVTITMEVQEKFDLPLEILSVPNNAYELLTKQQQDNLNELAYLYEEVANKAYDLWIRTLRWKANNGAVGRRSIDSAYFRNVRFFEMQKNKCLWVGGSGHVFHLRKHDYLKGKSME